MRKLIDVYNTNDARHIFFAEEDEWPMEFDVELLVKDSEEIIKQWESLRHSSKYESHLREKDYRLFQNLKRQALHIAYYAIQFGNIEVARDLIKEFRFECEPVAEQIERQIKLLNNWFRLHEEKEENENREPINWFNLIVFIEENSPFKVDYDCTVARYAAIDNRVEELMEAKRRAYAKES